MGKKNIWVTLHPDGGWQWKLERNERASGKTRTQKESIDKAVERAKKDGVEVIVQGKNRKIRSRDSYGKDPCPPKDKEH